MTGQTQDDDLLDFVAGRASDEVRARLEQQMKDDPALKADADLMAGLRSALQEEAMPEPGELGWKRLEAQIRRESRAAPPPARRWQIAAAVLGAVVLTQAVFLATRDAGTDFYSTASSGADAHVLAVGFRADAAQGAVSGLLHEVGGQIVGGPGATGLYRIGFDSADDLNAAIEALETSPLIDIVAEE